MKHSDLFSMTKDLEQNIVSALQENISRISDFADKRKDIGINNIIPINKDESATHVTHDFRVFIDNYAFPDKAKFVNFSFLTTEQQLDLLLELENIETEEDLEF